MSAHPADENARRNRGLLAEMFKVERLVPSSRGTDHSECRYFVLDPEHDEAALAALARYVQVARSEGRSALADDLSVWVSDIIARHDRPIGHEIGPRLRPGTPGGDR